MFRNLRVAFVAGLLAAAAFPLAFHGNAPAQSAGGSGSGGSGTGSAGTDNTGSARGADTTGTGARSGASGTNTGTGTAAGTTGSESGPRAPAGSLPGSNTTGTPVNRKDPPRAQAAPATPMERVNSQAYVENIGSSDMFEIASSQLALERSTNQRVQDFARKMVADHRQASGKMTQALSAGDSTLRPPSQMTVEHQRMVERLRTAKRGAEFDRMYLDMQARGHEAALAFHRSYANTGDNAALQGVARELVPIVEQHLAEVRRISGTASGDNPRQGTGTRRGGGS